MIELVVTDLDGTFWDRELRIPHRHAAAIETLAADGVPVLLATSRRKRVVEAVLRPVGWLPPAVLLDGALGVDLATGQRFHEAVFPKSAAAKVLAVFERHGLQPCLYVDDPEIDVVVPPRPSTCDAHVDYLRNVSRRATPAIFVDEGTVQGFSIFGGELALLEPLATVLRAVGAEVVLAEDDRFGGHSIVVSPPAVTKWNGSCPTARPTDWTRTLSRRSVTVTMTSTCCVMHDCRLLFGVEPPACSSSGLPSLHHRKKKDGLQCPN